MIDFNALAQAGIRSLRAYDPGHDLVALRRQAAQPLLELGSNENPYGASRLLKQAIIAALDGAHVYPDPLGGDLKRAHWRPRMAWLPQISCWAMATTNC